VELWRTQTAHFARSKRLIGLLGRKVTVAQAKRLDMLSLPYDALQDLRAQCKNPEEFMAVLHNKGVNSKLLREKLATIVRLPS